jgi:protein-tyrosine phosphatase
LRVCFVCLGNICRSPTAEAIFRAQVEADGRGDEFEIDSAGTGAWHVGSPADERAAAEARRHGIELTSRARQVSGGDFEHFDRLVAMDRSNRDDLLDLAPTPEARAKVELLRDREQDVPDPYYGGPTGFADVYAVIEQACAALLERLRD